MKYLSFKILEYIFWQNIQSCLYVCMVFVLLTGGKTGVYELEELLIVLREENAQDICVINIPPEVNLTDHMVIVSAISLRHLRAIMSTVNNIVSTYLYTPANEV